jgi:hypothetical protein
MATITSQERTDLRTDLGIPDDETIFTNTEMQRIWDRVVSAADATTKHFAALALMVMQLRNSSAKLHRYSVVSSSESQEQVFAHLNLLYQEYKEFLDSALSRHTRQVVFSSMRSVEYPDRESPSGEDEGWEDTDPYVPNYPDS